VRDCDHVVDKLLRHGAGGRLGILPGAVGTRERRKQGVEDDEEDIEDCPARQYTGYVGGKGAAAARVVADRLTLDKRLEQRPKDELDDWAMS